MSVKFHFYNHEEKHEEIREGVLNYMEEHRLTPLGLSQRTEIGTQTLLLFLIYKKPISYPTFCKLYDFYKQVKKKD